MNKQEKLKAIIDETDKLISKRVTSSSPEFQAWKTKAERFLINEYLDSPACLNEMGAVWVTQTEYTNIYVPSFDFGNPKYYQCSVDKNRMGAVLDGSDNCKAGMIELKNKIVELFGLSVDENQWIYALDQFMKEVSD